MIPSLFFTVDIKHAHDLAEVMQGHGVRVFPISGKTSDKELDRLNRQFRAGEIDGLSSCQMFLEAADYPIAMGAFMCRPTQSGLLYRQSIGRVLRPFPSPQGPRAYQQAALNAILRDCREGSVNLLLVLPTGTGKTRCAANLPKLVDYWKGTGKRGRILFLCHMDILASQTVEQMREVNPTLRVGLEKAESYAGDADIVVGSIQTLGPEDKKLGLPYNRRLRSFNPAHFDAVVYDEAHHLCGSQYGHTILRYFAASKVEPGCRDRDILLLAMTATPQRSDNVGLEKFCDKITYQYGIRSAIDDRFLAPIVAHRVETEIDLDAVKMRAGDFAVKQLEDTVNTEQRNELVAQKYLEICRLEGMEGEFRSEGFQKPHAVVVDFVDNCTKHQLISAPTLFGLRANFNPKGKDLYEQAKEIEDIQQKHPTLDLRAHPDMDGIRAALKSIDLLAPPEVPDEIRKVSKFAWLSDGSGYHLGRLDHTLLAVRQNVLGDWEVANHNRGVRSIMGTAPDLRKALRLAEDTLPVADQHVLRAKASWRAEGPTQPQCSRVWQLDTRVREKFTNPALYYQFCSGQFGGGNQGYSKGSMSVRIDLLQAQRV